MTDIPSPCRQTCQLDATRTLCRDCGRTTDEIAGWASYTQAERASVMRDLKARRRAGAAPTT